VNAPDSAPSRRILVFAAGGLRFGLPLADVREVVRSVAVDSLPGAPAVVSGAIDVRGEIAPVVDIRVRFGAEAVPVSATERFIICRTPQRLVALRADSTEWISEVRHIQEPEAVAAGLEHIRGIARLEDGLVLLYDLGTFLSDAESAALAEALARSAR
jgi:purine-binding chemotaxis protein CheW